jgi:hypothetical protein
VIHRLIFARLETKELMNRIVKEASNSCGSHSDNLRFKIQIVPDKTSFPTLKIRECSSSTHSIPKDARIPPMASLSDFLIKFCNHPKRKSSVSCDFLIAT